MILFKIISNLVIFFLFVIPLCPTQLNLSRTIVPQEPVDAWKIIVYENDIYLLCGSQRTVLAMNHKGEITKRFGRRGEGPGEFIYITDFTLCNKRLILGGGKRINTFSLNGQVLKSINIRESIQKLFSSRNQWYYMTTHFFKKSIKTTIAEFSIYNSENKCIYTFPDETMQQAYNPKKGKKLPFPWFPSPYCNRPSFVNGGKRKAALFMTREKKFYTIDNGKLEKKEIDVAFPLEKITPKDVDYFIEMLYPAPAKKTIKSLVFPEYKQYFTGTLPWEKGFALITEKTLIIIDAEGHYRETIAIPDLIKKSIRETGYLDGPLFKAKDLYLIKNKEEVLVFSID